MEIIEVFITDNLLESTILFYEQRKIKKIVFREKEIFYFLDNLYYNREMSLEDKYKSTMYLVETNKESVTDVDYNDDILIKYKDNERIKMYLREEILSKFFYTDLVESER